MAKKSKKSPQPETSQQSRDRAASSIPSSSQATPVPAKVDTLISTQGLVKAYKGRRVVNQVSIHIRPGEIVGLLGPNGAGKTTTFNMVVGIVRPDEGSVKFGNEVITDWPIHKRARLGIGYLTQEPSVFRGLTVRQNILAILETLKISKAERMERLDQLMNELDLTRLADSMAYALSGGEKRRLEVTRALVTNPSLLLLDEPFSGIDPVTVDEVQRIVRDLKGRGLGVLITDHKARETLKLVDRAYLIHQGEMLKEGDSDTLAKDPEARRVYLGQDFDWQ
jgi:lipopolysaccharide export system ATP-binding protein